MDSLDLMAIAVIVVDFLQNAYLVVAYKSHVGKEIAGMHSHSAFQLALPVVASFEVVFGKRSDDLLVVLDTFPFYSDSSCNSFVAED